MSLAFLEESESGGDDVCCDDDEVEAAEGSAVEEHPFDFLLL